MGPWHWLRWDGRETKVWSDIDCNDCRGRKKRYGSLSILTKLGWSLDRTQTNHWTLLQRVWSTPALYEKCSEITYVMNWGYVNKMLQFIGVTTFPQSIISRKNTESAGGVGVSFSNDQWPQVLVQLILRHTIPQSTSFWSLIDRAVPQTGSVIDMKCQIMIMNLPSAPPAVCITQWDWQCALLGQFCSVVLIQSGM